jgi:hypothetical protein
VGLRWCSGDGMTMLRRRWSPERRRVPREALAARGTAELDLGAAVLETVPRRGCD